MIKLISRLESFSEGNEASGYDDISREFKRALGLERRGEPVRMAFTVTFQGDDTRPKKERKSPDREGALIHPLPKGAYEVGLFRDKGIRPSILQADIERLGGFGEALRYRVHQRTDIWHRERIVRVEMHLFPAP